MKKINSCAPGKTILFGEHSVVYGYPAISMAINIQSYCEITEISEDSIELIFDSYNIKLRSAQYLELIDSIPEKFKQFSLCFQIFKRDYGIEFENTRIHLSSDLFPGSGLGSSASTSIALINGINNFYQLGLSREDMSDIGYKMEEVVHGSPSGIDNTTCTYGNIINYEKGEFEFLTSPVDLKILISYTDIEHDTKKAINNIKMLKEEKPDIVSKYLKEMGSIAKSAKKALGSGNILEMGRLMNRNQQLLSLLGVSNEKIDFINKIANSNGAYGSKLTGAGLGGCVITLGEKKTLERISQLLKKREITNFLTSINEKGVRTDEE
jgi:mevalonate kinase